MSTNIGRRVGSYHRHHPTRQRVNRVFNQERRPEEPAENNGENDSSDEEYDDLGEESGSEDGGEIWQENQGRDGKSRAGRHTNSAVTMAQFNLIFAVLSTGFILLMPFIIFNI